MADRSKIEWTEATWNPITGCSLASPGCTNCYAMKLAGTRMKHHPSREGLTQQSKAGPVWTGEVRFNEQWLDQPLRWAKPRMIFVCAHGDLFHESVPDEWIDRVFAVMALCPQHTFQVLTKRSARMREYLTNLTAARLMHASRAFPQAQPQPLTWPLPNVWLGVSAENQHWLMQRACDLVETPAAVRWLSCEPLLQPLDVEPFVLPVRQWSNGWANNYPFNYPENRIDWIVVGGESGPNARPMHPDWARSLRDQCAAAGVPFFFKQWGEWAPFDPADAFTERDPEHNHKLEARHVLNPGERCGAENLLIRSGKKHAGRLLDGFKHDGMPEAWSRQPEGDCPTAGQAESQASGCERPACEGAQ